MMRILDCIGITVAGMACVSMVACAVFHFHPIRELQISYKPNVWWVKTKCVRIKVIP